MSAFVIDLIEVCVSATINYLTIKRCIQLSV